jgi:hypothetical protein
MIKALRRARAALAVVVLAGSSAHAADSTFSVRLGDADLTLPVPAGYAEPSLAPPAIARALAAALPARNRLLGILTPVGTARNAQPSQKIERYFIVQANRQSEQSGIPPGATFEQVKKILRAKLVAQPPGKDPAVQANLDRYAHEAASSSRGGTLAVEHRNTMPPRLLADEPDLLEYSTVSEFALSDGNGTRTAKSATTVAYMFIKGRILEVNAYARYRTDQDLHWTEVAMSAWTARARKLNTPGGASAP